MMRKILLGGVMVVALAAPASAQDQCVAPTAPTIQDGARATKVQMTKALGDVKAFIAASDDYQACMLRMITANQKEKERIGAEYGVSARAYNTAQQQQQRQSQQTPFAPPSSMGDGGRY